MARQMTCVRKPVRAFARTVAGLFGCKALLATAFTGPQAAWAETAAADAGTAQAAGGAVKLPVALTALTPRRPSMARGPTPTTSNGSPVPG